MTTKLKANGLESLERLYQRPGFLLRRAHQISEGVFEAECAAFGLTPPQAGCLVVAHSCPGLDQKAIGLALGLDRANTGEILKGLEGRGLVVRAPSKEDGRKRLATLTSAGRKILEQAGEALNRSQQKLLGPFSADERRLLISLLGRLCDAHNEQARTLLAPPDEISSNR
jgi:DNA-binding MarR family transcriptional regulator